MTPALLQQIRKEKNKSHNIITITTIIVVIVIIITATTTTTTANSAKAVGLEHRRLCCLSKAVNTKSAKPNSQSG
jgi:flagellar basal body-associated protein FliL